MDIGILSAQMPEEVREMIEKAMNTQSGKACQVSSDYERQRIRWANEAAGTLEGGDCPVCHNRGYTVDMVDGYIVSMECPCMAKRRSIQRIKRSGLGGLLERCTFASYQTPERWQAAAKAKAAAYLKNPDGKWFVASGCVGSGKTHLCTAICGELIQAGVEVRYMRWKDEVVELNATLKDAAEYKRLITPLKTVRCLYIDDFWKAGNGNVTKGEIDRAFEILNARNCDDGMITIISTEWTLADMMKIDEAVGSRIYERAKSSCIELTGNKNWRLK